MYRSANYHAHLVPLPNGRRAAALPGVGGWEDDADLDTAITCPVIEVGQSVDAVLTAHALRQAPTVEIPLWDIIAAATS